MKLIRGALLRPLLDVLREERWLLDIELLVLLKRQGARALEVPIDWEDFGGSKVIPGLDGLRMFWGLLQLRRRLERLSLPAPTAPESLPASESSPAGVMGSDRQ